MSELANYVTTHKLCCVHNYLAMQLSTMGRVGFWKLVYAFLQHNLITTLFSMLTLYQITLPSI